MECSKNKTFVYARQVKTFLKLVKEMITLNLIASFN